MRRGATATMVGSAIGRAARIAVAVTVCGILWTLLLSVGHIDGVPLHVTVFLLATAALSGWKPEAGLLLLAALLPVAGWLGSGWNSAVAWPEALVVAFGAGYAARVVVRSSASLDDIDLPLMAFAAVVIASLAVELAVLRGGLGSEAFAAYLWQLAWNRFYLGNAGLPAVDAAVRLLEGLLLFRASVAVAQIVPHFALRLTQCLVVGAAAAAGLNVLRLWQAAYRQDPLAPLSRLLEYFAVLRVNVHHGDLNAAGSYFVMALFPAAALVVMPPRFRWSAASFLIAAGLWISGSRAALLAGALAAVLPAFVALRYLPGIVARRALAGALLVTLAVAAAGAHYLPRRDQHAPSSVALRVRLEFVVTSVRMLATRPLAGVGVGQYPARAGEFTSPELLEIFPGGGRENAHNNFLQILAELGIVGFAAFVWLLGAVALRCAPLLRTGSAQPLGLGVATGLLAFVITWFAGHPLLVDAAAFPFWILLGTAAGWGSAIGARRPWQSPRLGAATIVMMAAMALSVLPRTERGLAEANLDHVGIGVSVWHHGRDGVRFRTAAAESVVFVPADARVVSIPLRAMDPTATLTVELRLGNRQGDVIQVPGDRWHHLRMILPERATRRFSPLSLRVVGTGPNDPVLMIGKVEPR